MLTLFHFDQDAVYAVNPHSQLTLDKKEGRLLIVDPQRGEIVTLNQVGAEVFELFQQQSLSFKDLLQRLAHTYQLSTFSSAQKKEIAVFIKDLEKRQYLIKVK